MANRTCYANEIKTIFHCKFNTLSYFFIANSTHYRIFHCKFNTLSYFFIANSTSYWWQSANRACYSSLIECTYHRTYDTLSITNRTRYCCPKDNVNYTWITEHVYVIQVNYTWLTEHVHVIQVNYTWLTEHVHVIHPIDKAIAYRILHYPSQIKHIDHRQYNISKAS